MIDTKNIEEAKKLLKKEPTPKIVKSQGLDFNRKILKYGKFSSLLLNPTENRKTTLRKVESSIDYVCADLASKNNISFSIDLKQISPLEKKQKALFLEELIQIIKIARKAKTKLNLLNYKDKKDAFSFLLSLGSSTQQAKEAL